MALQEKIKYEGESTTLDFKQSLYAPRKRADLISDVMAMANAFTKDDRYIVFGIKLAADGTKTFHALGPIPDPAEIEQLILSNIEPAVHIEFSPMEFEGNQIAYLRIHHCEDQPYLMRKDYESLVQGTGKIRKGTTTLPLQRVDLDEMYSAKSEKEDLRQYVKVYWLADPPSEEVRIGRPAHFVLPSAEEATRIQSHIERHSQPSTKKLEERNTPEWYKGLQAMFPGPHDPYASMTLKELDDALAKVKEKFQEDDEFEVYKNYGTNLNLLIANEGPQYLDDVAVTLTFPIGSRFHVAPRVALRPVRRSSMLDLVHPDYSMQFQNQIQYPSVSSKGDFVFVRSTLDHVKNGEFTKVFGKPLRVILYPESVTQTIRVQVKVVARQFRRPFESELFIHPS